MEISDSTLKVIVRRDKDIFDKNIIKFDDYFLLSLRNCCFLVAKKMGMHDSDAEDCASDFVLFLLCCNLSLSNRLCVIPLDKRKAYLKQAIVNHTRNYARTLRRHYYHEYSEGDVSDQMDQPSNLISPEQYTIQAAELARIHSGISSLSSIARRIFLLYYIYQTELSIIAEDLGCTVAAVKQSLYRSRKTIIAWIDSQEIN